jgi:hypothetical protein
MRIDSEFPQKIPETLPTADDRLAGKGKRIADKAGKKDKR